MSEERGVGVSSAFGSSSNSSGASTDTFSFGELLRAGIVEFAFGDRLVAPDAMPRLKYWFTESLRRMSCKDLDLGVGVDGSKFIMAHVGLETCTRNELIEKCSVRKISKP